MGPVLGVRSAFFKLSHPFDGADEPTRLVLLTAVQLPAGMIDAFTIDEGDSRPLPSKRR